MRVSFGSNLLLRFAAAAFLGGAVSLAPARATEPAAAARTELRFDSKTSRLTVETETVGLASLFGHDHKFDVREFAGKIGLAPGAPQPADLELVVRGETLTLLEDVSDDVHREIGAALRAGVLETGKYPQIAFRGRTVTARKNEDGSYDVKLAGDLEMHGVRRKITVPARVTFTPGGLRATGALELRQSDFKIKPFTFAKGTVKIRDVVGLSFDVVGKR